MCIRDSRFYPPGNMVFFFLGNLGFRQVVRWAEKLLAELPAVAVDNRRTPPPLYVPEHLVVHKLSLIHIFKCLH